MSKTLFDKIWESHQIDDSLIYIDRHLVHEVTSPQAFEGLRLAGRKIRHKELIFAVADHNVPTTKDRLQGIKDDISRLQVETLEQNCKDFDIEFLAMSDIRQGVIHVSAAEQGAILPATTAVCGDSHTSTHGAFGALAFGIGTSEVEHVLATQTLIQKPAKNMQININGKLAQGVTAKDIVLAIIGKLGTAGGTGYIIEYTGEIIKNLSMEGRMTICNMSIEVGAKAGLIAPDETTFAYLKNRPMSPKGKMFEQAVAYWRNMVSDKDAKYDAVININANEIIPQVTWGTSPEDVLPITGFVPSLDEYADAGKTKAVARSLEYMGLKAGQKLTDIIVDKIFIGSCTNGRIEDLRSAAAILKGHKIADNIKLAMVVPGTGLVKKQAEDEGLDKIFIKAGFEWREAGCSMCLAMNDDKLSDGERCASTSNRNFEGRQGRGGRTHLVSPAMAAAAAIKGKLADVREFQDAEI